VIKLITGQNDEVMFAVGRQVGVHKMLLLEVIMPQEEATDISVKEIAALPNLSHHCEFTARIVSDHDGSHLLLAALLDANECGIYKVRLSGPSSG
jgi:hypothetical protein